MEMAVQSREDHQRYCLGTPLCASPLATCLWCGEHEVCFRYLRGEGDWQAPLLAYYPPSPAFEARKTAPANLQSRNHTTRSLISVLPPSCQRFRTTPPSFIGFLLFGITQVSIMDVDSTTTDPIVTQSVTQRLMYFSFALCSWWSFSNRKIFRSDQQLEEFRGNCDPEVWL